MRCVSTHTLDGLGRDLAEAAATRDAGVGDDDVDAPERVERGAKRLRGRRRSDDRVIRRHRFSTGCSNLGHERVGRFAARPRAVGVAAVIVDDDACAACGQQLGVGGAETSAGAGHDGYLSIEAQFVHIDSIRAATFRAMTDASMNATVETLAARLDRLTSPRRDPTARGQVLCLALDMRALDALAGLFPDDVRVGRGLQGRKRLRRWFDATLREQFDGTAHVTGNHIIEFDDPDHARGIVYSRNEHETGREWVIMTMMYWDRYERIDGRWYFRRRLPLYWYRDRPQPAADRAAQDALARPGAI